MEEKIINFDSKEYKKAEFKRKAKQKWDSFTNWYRSNSDVLVVMVPVVTVGISGGVKIISKVLTNHRTNKEIRFKETTIYDHSLGKYVFLKRPLTAAQSLTIEERRAGGEKLHTILDDMGLLKK